MMWFRGICLLLISGVLLGTHGCDRSSPFETGDGVRANGAYLSYFGEPPSVERGVAYARVGFFPRRDAPGKVTPVPFFLYREEGQLPLLLERLTSGEVFLPDSGPLFDPLPPGSQVRILSRTEERVSLNVIPARPLAAEELVAVAGALVETATQFPEIHEVRLALNGTPFPGMPQDGFEHEAGRVLPPDPPQLQRVIVLQGEVDLPVSFQAEFDRPVTVEIFSLEDGSGARIEGDYFTTAFDMAVVVHPEKVSPLAAGDKVRVAWRVVDGMGRRGVGAGELVLQLYGQTQGT